MRRLIRPFLLPLLWPERVVAVLLLFQIPTYLPAQERGIEFHGSEIFCHLLQHFQLAPIVSIAELGKHAPEETIIIVFGNPAPLREPNFPIAPKRRDSPDWDGYAMLLASNHPTGPLPKPWQGRASGSLLAPWKLTIANAEVQQPAEEAYEGKSYRPFLKPEQLSSNHPIFRGIHLGVATHEPKHLVGEQSDLLLLATFPKQSFAVTPNLEFERTRELQFALGTAGDSATRTLVMASQGVFSNGLMVKADVDNFLFAYNTIRWLRQHPEGERKYALMIHDGRVVTNFELPAGGRRQLPQPPIQIVNNLLRKLENEGIVNRFLEERIGWRNVLRFALLSSVLVIFVWGTYRLFLMRYAPESTPLIFGAGGDAGGRRVADQRTLELVIQDNLWEPAQALARQWFLDHARTPAPLWDEAGRMPLPIVAVSAGWWQRRRFVRQLRLLWDFAIRDPSRRVSLREFGRLTTVLQSMTHAIQSGAIRFPMASRAVADKKR